MKTAISSVIGGVVTYIVVNTLITTMITGTGTGDTLKLGAFNRKVGMITHQIRGTLNAFGRMLTTELSRMGQLIWACGETRRCESLKEDYGIVRTLTKVNNDMEHQNYRPDRPGCHGRTHHTQGCRLIPVPG